MSVEACLALGLCMVSLWMFFHDQNHKWEEKIRELHWSVIKELMARVKELEAQNEK